MQRREKMFHSEKFIGIPGIPESFQTYFLRDLPDVICTANDPILSSLHDTFVGILAIGGYTIFCVRRRKKFLRQQETE